MGLPMGAPRQQTRFPVRHDSTAPTVLAGSYSAQRMNTPNTAAADDATRVEPTNIAQEPGRSRDTSADAWTPMMAASMANAQRSDSREVTTFVQVAMPFCSREGGNYPYFNGTNITRFLREFDDLCDTCRVPEAERTRRVLRFMSSETQETSEGLVDEDKDDWETFKENLRDEFSDKDQQQQMLTKHYLEALASRKRSSKSDLKNYLQQFHKGALAILKKRAETDDALCKLFMKGMPDHYAVKIVKKMNLHPNHPERADFVRAYKLANKLWNEDFNATRYIQGTAGDTDFYELAKEKEGKPSQKKAEQRRERDIRKEQHVTYAPVSERVPTPGLPEDREMADIVARTKAMTLPVVATDRYQAQQQILELLRDVPSEAIGASRVSNVALRQHSNDKQARFEPISTQQRRGSYSSSAPLLCFLCIDQHPIRDCPWYNFWRGHQFIHFNTTREICLGKWEGANSTQKPPIQFPANLAKLQRLEFVAGKIRDELRADPQWTFGETNPEVVPPSTQWYRTARAQAIRIGGTPNDEFLADSEDDSRVHVATAYIRLDEPEFVHLDPKRTAAEQGGRADPKVPRTVPYDPPRPQLAQRSMRSGGPVAFDGVTGNTSGIDISTNHSVPNGILYNVQDGRSRDPNSQDTVMDDGPDPARIQQRSRGHREAQYGPAGPMNLKKAYSIEQNGAAELVQLALNAPISTTLGQLLSNKEFREEFLTKQHWHYDDQKRTLVHQPHAPKNVRSATVDEVPGVTHVRQVQNARPIQLRSDPLVQPRLHQKPSPYLPVLMRGKTEYALLDTGAEVNLMTLGLVEEMGLTTYMRKPGRITHAMGFTGEEGQFVGVIKDVLINVAGVQIPTIFYVSASTDPSFRCILGTPWQAAARLKLEYKDDNTTVVGISATGENYLWILAYNTPEIMDDGAINDLRELAREPRLAIVKSGAGRKF
jgi:hypothetical protein